MTFSPRISHLWENVFRFGAVFSILSEGHPFTSCQKIKSSVKGCPFLYASVFALS